MPQDGAAHAGFKSAVTPDHLLQPDADGSLGNDPGLWSPRSATWTTSGILKFRLEGATLRRPRTAAPAAPRTNPQRRPVGATSAGAGRCRPSQQSAACDCLEFCVDNRTGLVWPRSQRQVVHHLSKSVHARWTARNRNDAHAKMTSAQAAVLTTICEDGLSTSRCGLSICEERRPVPGPRRTICKPPALPRWTQEWPGMDR